MVYRHAYHPVTREQVKAYASDELDAALAAIDTKCSHEEKDWRQAKIANGGIQICRFCLTCGEKLSLPESRNNFASLPDFFDYKSKRESTIENREMARFDLIKSYNRRDIESQKAFARDYGNYLKSDAWLEKRQRVLSKANHVCEGCGINPASEVHHLTYANRFFEFLFELVALCPQCHSLIHFDKNDRIRSSPLKSDEGIRCEGCRWSGEENQQRWCMIHDAPAQSSLKSENLCHEGRNGFEGLK